jgi:assimilatory nitrate reductase catalytic subunit
MVRSFRGVQAAHGPEALAFLGTGQLPIEELAFFGALCKFGLGMRHGDGNTRQCMATAVTAYKQAFGFDAPPYTYEDLEESDVLVFVGANPAVAHPILWERVLKSRRAPAIVVLDPRRTETAEAATLHLPLAPKSDLAVLYAVAHVLIDSGRIDRAFVDAHTSGFADFAAHVAAFTPARAAAASGLSVAQIEAFARLVHERERVSYWWTMGVNQSHQGVRTAQALIDLALLGGHVGRPGTGANSITGQCNAMGSRLFANTTTLLGGHAFDDPHHRQKVADQLGLDEALVPRDAGWAYDQILEGIARGAIRGLWIVGTNTAHSWLSQHDTRELLARLDVLVVQDMYADTATAKLADIVLPAAGWGEKQGVFINSERRLGLIHPVAPAPGQALSDFRIFQLVAEAFDLGERFARWSSPEAVFRLLTRLTEGRPCDLTGLSGYADLAAAGGVQWPLPAGQDVPAQAARRLFADGRFFTSDGRARFVFAEPTPLPEPARGDYPFTLLTGRGTSAEWHTLTRTSPVLRKLAPSEPHVEIHPDDAAALAIAPAERVRVRSRRGAIELRAFVTPTVPRGHVFVPMHVEAANVLTFPAVDPESRQPAYKASAVALEPLGTGAPP